MVFFEENILRLTQINQLKPRQRFENNPSRVCAIFTVSYIYDTKEFNLK